MKNYTIEKCLILATTHDGCEFANSEYCENIVIAADYDDEIHVLYRASDFDDERKNAFDSFESINHSECPQEIGDGHAGTVTIASVLLSRGYDFIVFEGTQTFGSEFEESTDLG